MSAPTDDAARRAEGMKMRRAVLGDAYVDRAVASKSAFNADFQDYITRTAWGDVWLRPGLDRRTRSVVVLSAAVALGAWEEFRIHVRGAIANGLTPEEIAEVLTQLAVYAGVPRANTAYKEARAILAEMGLAS
ncbi:MAG: carboxymuconolactone decarboxylase family protein [Methylobacteriaceae bacterium]|nr:carboxymuconolactone decarboxylase family protein [Methylobacteriaceae bacterium]